MDVDAVCPKSGPYEALEGIYPGYGQRKNCGLGRSGQRIDPFGGPKPRLLRQVKRRRSEATLSKPRPTGRGVEGLTTWVKSGRF
jgi:hypothetical protein